MRYVSLFSGIESASVAWGPLGWTPLAFAEVEPFPSAVLAHRFPDVPNVGDVTAHDWERYRGRCDLVVGGPPCFPAGVRVLTDAGLVPIEAVKIGDRVLTHAGRYMPVVAVGSKHEAETVLLKGQGHHGLRVTPNHPILSCRQDRVWRRGSKRDGGPSFDIITTPTEWTPAGKMEGRRWCRPTAYPELPVPIPEAHGNERQVVPFSAAFFFVVGACIGNGWTRIDKRRSSLVLSCRKERAERFAASLTAAGLRFTRTEERTATKLHVASSALAKWFDAHFGHGAPNKRIPAWALGMREEWRQALFDGLMATDGSPTKGGWSLTTTSTDLAFGASMLAGTLGLSATMTPPVAPRGGTCVIEGRTVNERPFYSVRFNRSDRHARIHEGYRLGLVRHVVPDAPATVYNLEVEGDHSYTADGIVVHNCQAFSIAGLRGSMSDARGNLSLAYVKVIHAIDPVWSVTENVPGWLSTGDNAFGCFLAGMVGEDAPLVPTGGRWTDAGMVVGPARVCAWRVLDAQYFGLAQRRRRVFVVSGRAGDLRPAAALLELEGLPRHFAPRRRSGQGVAGSPTAGLGSRGADDNAGQAGHVVPAPRVGGGEGEALTGHQVLLQNNGRGGNRQVLGLDEPHPTLNLREPNAVLTTPAAYQCQGSNVGPMGTLRKGNGDVTGGRPFVAHAFDARQQDVVQYGDRTGPLDTDPSTIAVAHTLRGTGHDASEDGTGRGVPLVPTCFDWQAAHTPAIDADLCPTMTKSQTKAVSSPAYGVRRLSCIEMERLQGFPDGWTLIPYGPARKRIEDDEAAYLRRHWPHLGDEEIRRLAKDGPRAKALGNSMAVPCMRWIGERIALLDRERP